MQHTSFDMQRAAPRPGSVLPRAGRIGSRGGLSRRVGRAVPLDMSTSGGDEGDKMTVSGFFAKLCRSIKSFLAAVGLMDGGDKGGEKAVTLQVEHFAKALNSEINQWVNQVQDMEDKKLQELRSSLENISELLNRGVFSSGDASVKELLETWRTTDPATRDLFRTVRRIRAEYDIRVKTLTDVVKPLSKEEIYAATGSKLEQIVQSIDANVEFVEDFSPMTDAELSERLAKLGLSDLQRSSIAAAEEQLRAGFERARFSIWSRLKNREVEAGAATLDIKNGTLWASAINSGVRVPVFENIGPSMYMDDTDGKNIFLGMRATQELSQHKVRLGTLPATAGRWLSCARQKLWWMSPDVGSRDDVIPPETQFFLADVGEGMYVLVLPLVGNSFRTALWGAEKGAIDVRLESGDPAVKTKLVATSVLISAGTDPFLLLERAFAAAADRLGTFRIRAEKQLPPSLDVFGWCTWDAFYSAVEPQGVKDGLRQLAAGGTPSRMLILDDGWQSTDNDADYRFSDSEVRGDVGASELAGGGVVDNQDYAAAQLTSLKDIPARILTWWYSAVIEKSDYDSTSVKIWRWLTHNVIKQPLMKYFAEATDWSKRLTSILPNDKFMQLSTLVRELKSDYGLKYTYCWHALTGYWLGVDPNSPGMARYKPVIQYPCINPHFDYTPGVLSAEPTMAWNPSSFVGVGMIPPEHIQAFFNELHQSLHDAGIEGVKCDAQAAITMLGAGYGGGPKITRAYIHAMENSVAEHLDGNCINCMCHPTENIYSFQKTAVARASDDFYPREPASHTVHILNVVYNTLFLGEIVHPDWDMFQSEHPAARLHAAARAVGGCAVYTSDRPDVHDFTLLRKLVLPDGAVLRARLPGRPTRDCLFADPATDGKTGLKVWNRNFHGGVIGAFNLQGACWDRSIRNFREPEEPPPAVTVQFKPADVEGLVSETGKYVTWQHEAASLRVLERHEEVSVELPPQGSEVLTVMPLYALKGVKGKGGEQDGAVWSPLGLPAMINSGGAVLRVQLDQGVGLSLKEIVSSVRKTLSYAAAAPTEGPLDPSDLLGATPGGEGALDSLEAALSLSGLSGIPGASGGVDGQIDGQMGAPGAGSVGSVDTGRGVTRPKKERDRSWLSLSGAGGATGGPAARGGEFRAVVEVKGQGRMLAYSSVRPVKVLVQDILPRGDAGSGGWLGGVRQPGSFVGGRQGSGSAAGWGQGSGGGVDGASSGLGTRLVQVGARVGALVGEEVIEAPWVEWDFEYDEQGAVSITLPDMKPSDDMTGGRWSIAYIYKKETYD